LSSFKLAADLAISKPTPLLAPVINHTLFFSMIIVLFWFSQNLPFDFFLLTEVFLKWQLRSRLDEELVFEIRQPNCC
jgi:hypothetical protein